MIRRGRCLRCIALPASLVSFRRAPGFQQAPPEMLRGSTRSIPATSLPCYCLPSVITPQEEAALLLLTSRLFDRLPFADGHVDSLIHHYKEFYRSGAELLDPSGQGLADIDAALLAAAPPPLLAAADLAALRGVGAAVPGPALDAAACECRAVVRAALARCTALAQAHCPHIPLQDRVHCLQLHTTGFIRAHADEARNSSGIVAGLTLGTARVMTLTHPRHSGAAVDLLLAPRSLYLLCGTARTEWEHSVDWEADDADHAARAARAVPFAPPEEARSATDPTRPVLFDGVPSGFFRGTRAALIWRGVSPMELLMRRMEARRAAEEAAATAAAEAEVEAELAAEEAAEATAADGATPRP